MPLDEKAGESAVDFELYRQVVDWMNSEAELLDTAQERRWIETMVSKDVIYRVPLRQTVERARGDGFVPQAYHLDETYGSLAKRVARIDSPQAWADNPPSRIRHFVTNIRVSRRDDGDLAVKTNLLVFRTRGDHSRPQFLSCERQDVLRHEDGALKLVHRDVLLDHSVIETHNLAVFF